MVDFTAGAAGFAVGLATAGLGMYRFLVLRISHEEASRIYQDVKKTIADYEAAKADGTLTTDDRIILAEDVMAVVEEIVQDLEH